MLGVDQERTKVKIVYFDNLGKNKQWLQVNATRKLIKKGYIIRGIMTIYGPRPHMSIRYSKPSRFFKSAKHANWFKGINLAFMNGAYNKHGKE